MLAPIGFFLFTLILQTLVLYSVGQVSVAYSVSCSFAVLSLTHPDIYCTRGVCYMHVSDNGLLSYRLPISKLKQTNKNNYNTFDCLRYFYYLFDWLDPVKIVKRIEHNVHAVTEARAIRVDEIRQNQIKAVRGIGKLRKQRKGKYRQKEK